MNREGGQEPAEDRSRLIPIKDITRLPFITQPPTHGRVLFLLTCFDDATREWFTYLPFDKEHLVHMKGGEIITGLYWAKTPADPSRDYEWFLGTFVCQHLSFARVMGAFKALTTQVHHLATVMKKYELLSLASSRDPGLASLLVGSELSHLTVLIRRFYDVLQWFSRSAAALVRPVDDPSRKLFKELPDSFAEVALVGERVRTVEEITAKWGIVGPIAQFYVTEALWFARVRRIRTAIEHGGQSPSLLLNHAEGVAVSIHDPAWKDLPIWNEKTTRSPDLGSARAIFAYLVSDALDLCSRFVKAYWSCVGTPQAVADDLKCYLRSPLSHHLLTLPMVLEQPWERLKPGIAGDSASTPPTEAS